MAVAVQNTTMVLNTITTVTRNAATSSTIDQTEVFTITPTKSDEKVLIYIENVAADQGTVTYSIAAGGYWAAGAALTGSVAQGVGRAIVLEGAKYKAQAGTIAITFTPATGKRLLTDHALRVSVIQMP
ncbi:hypothetical protein B1748_23530 [Paenibacillus sp. MY03]|uniref:hypothetical protein n=1 Tax=Paenibacillus sp. MY03 TaxID=302980 RepID=UPI000B3CC831|nr:hypothetical protein [Paenibacillus sp. MY03]OUS72983.1 hypothetical protein B1748_23530 [Paenibacillus sp. MY03]